MHRDGHRGRPAVVVLAMSVILAACGGPVALPGRHPPRYGTAIAGIAWPCVGEASRAAVARIPVDVVLMSRSKVIAREVVGGGTTYRFATGPGTYVVSSNAPYLVPVTVTVHTGHVTRADLDPNCK
jgi:hypothetical protein